MEPVTFINCFEVPAGREEEFFRLWCDVNEYMRKQPGYLSHRLHRSIQPDARFRFVNVARWESAESWQAAHDDGFRALVSRPAWKGFPPSGALFEIASEYWIGAHDEERSAAAGGSASRSPAASLRERE